MTKHLKRTVSILLTLLIVAGLFTIIPFTAAAETVTADVDGEWVKGTIAAQSWSSDGIYSFGDLKQKVVFCRIKKDETPSFEDGICYNKTDDLDVPSNNTWKMESWFAGTWYIYGLEGTVSGKYIDVRTDNTRNDVDWYAWTWNTKTLTKVDAVAATFDTPGNIEHYTDGSGNNYKYDNGSYVAVADVITPATGEVYPGHSISLDGDISLNFFFNISAEQAAQINADGGASFSWTVNNEEKTATALLTKDAATGYYIAGCPVSSAEMTYEIKASVTISGTTYTDTSTVKAYADTIIRSSNDADLVNLVKAMLDYGTEAQKRFNRPGTGYANGGTNYFSNDPQVSDVPAAPAFDGLTYKGSTVVYLSETTLRHYFTNDGSFTPDEEASYGDFVYGGARDGMIWFEKKDIPANELKTAFRLTIGSANYDFAVTDYAALAIQNNTASANLAKATIRYADYASDYFNRNNA